MDVRKAETGTVSHGTLRIPDLLESFANELEHHVQRNAEAWCSDAGRRERDNLLALVHGARECNPESEGEREIAEDLFNELYDALNIFAPDKHYFGAHPGDGSDFGYWPVD